MNGLQNSLEVNEIGLKFGGFWLFWFEIQGTGLNIMGDFGEWFWRFDQMKYFFF